MKDTIIQTVKLLCSALRNLSLYPASHPAISQPVEKCYQSILVLFKEREPLVMGIIDDVLLFDEIPFYETDTIWKELHRRMTVHKIESVTFAGELEQRELKAFINCLDLPAEESEQEGGFAALLEAQEVSHIRIKEIEEDLRERAREVYDHSLTLVYDIMSELRMGRIPSGEGAKAVMSDMQDIILKDKSALLALTMLKGYDNYTYVHSVNVGVLCLAFGAHEKLEPEAMRSLGLAGMLHDVGKVRTAEDIIKKPGSLTEAEITIMKKHPVLGAEIISRMQGISQETHEMVLLHHVKHNLKGYPKIESGREVHPYSMAVALADCYDALTTLRPYQKPRPPSDAVKVMRKLAGKDLDPVMLERFVDMLGTYPAGTFVRLTSNEIAIIRKPNELNVTLPKVRIVTDGNGAHLGAPEEVDLAENSTAPGSEPRAVVAGVNPIVYGLDPAKYL
jgi:HD-GYP domain-containing protein (c-di-GMP phosphodiesterase class II)